MREDGKLHVFLRPIDKARLGSVGEQIMEALEMSPDEVIPVGDKSSPEDISAYFYGISKRDFKNAVGVLYREKARPGPFTTELISEDDREKFLAEQAEMKAQYEKNKESRFQGHENQDRTIFVGNLPSQLIIRYSRTLLRDARPRQACQYKASYRHRRTVSALAMWSSRRRLM